MKKFVCVHGHFYQPPRENAWLEKIEYQDSAAPFHDWNERITAECYAPNGVSRILNDDRKIIDIVNNYAKMSFNFGPTLLSWLELNHPKTYQSILDADKESMKHFGGHGSAMAQVYNHIIMPLASRRDKETQVIWGLYDFEKRFNRKAEGMWLAETAVDTETLEVLAENGIKFTVLAPRQAKQYKSLTSEVWHQGIDPKQPYVINLPSGKRISLYFYDGERSQAVAFKGLLKDGREFANHLISAFDGRNDNQLLHIATDGESYGHHHRYGDMALAYCIHYIETHNLARVTNYAEYLELNPPAHEVQIHDNSSWSCVHGVERWRADCGCNSGGRSDWNQHWRKPLRDSLDWLRDELAKVFESDLGKYTKDVWALRNAYIEVALNRSTEIVEQFMKKHFAGLEVKKWTHVIRLLEMQRQEMLMYTSCGWFFDEISGIETVQILQYACRAMQLAESETSVKLEPKFLSMLAAGASNLPEYGNGDNVYRKFVSPSQLTLTQIGMHYAVSSLFIEDPNEISVFNYRCKSTHFKRIVQGYQKLAVGRAFVKSSVTLSEKNFSYVVLYIGQHHIIGKAFEDIPLDEYHIFVEQVITAFGESNISKVIELFKLYPEQRSFSFFDMFKDEQIKMLNSILDYNLDLAKSSYEKINDRNYNIINVMRNGGLKTPKLLVRNLDLVLQSELRDLFDCNSHRINTAELRRIIQEIKKWNFEIDHTDLNFICANKLNSMIREIGPFTNGNPSKYIDLFVNIKNALEILGDVDLYPELNNLQDYFFTMLRDLPEDLPADTMKEMFSFGEYINLDVSGVRKVIKIA